MTADPRSASEAPTADPAGSSAADLVVPRAPLDRARSARAETSFVAMPAGEPLPHLSEPVCAPIATAEELTAFFDGGTPMIGADYQRAYPLPGGRVLWLFQDAFLPTWHGPELVHNVGLLQSGQCFQLLRNGSADAPTPYLLPERTDRYDHWFWALDGAIGDDGNLHLFVAEIVERGPRYLTRTEPIATWLVTIDVGRLDVLDARPAPNPSQELYGWSVVSAGEHTYLYAHCYRQFGWDVFPFSDPPFRSHDWTCGPNVTVARIPRGDFDATPQYWDGEASVGDPSTGAPVIPRDGRSVNPSQIALFDGRFVAVTNVGDWWGQTIHLDVADAAEGPWTTYTTVTVTPSCNRCNSYFASVVPFGHDATSFVIGVSTNTWEGHDLARYEPVFLTVPAP